MPVIGILCSDNARREAAEQTLKLLTAKKGMDCAVCKLGEQVRERESAPAEKSQRIFCLAEEFFSQMERDWERRELLFLLLAWENWDTSWELAQRFWTCLPSLSIVYLARDMEEVSLALRCPFFHIVRVFAMEQDLQAALWKSERLRRPRAGRAAFWQGENRLVLPKREILYLDSDRHEILVHTKKEVFRISETLSVCEEKLKQSGFIRIHKSFLVNMYHIYRLERESVLLSNEERLYISRYRYPEVKLQFEDYIRHLDFMWEE